MGNALRCLEGRVEGDLTGEEHYPYYRPTSSFTLQGRTTDAPPPPPPSTHRRVLGHHGYTGAAALEHQYILDFKPPASSVPAFGHLHGSNDVTDQQEDIDESSAEVLRSAESYAKAHAMLIQVQVLGRPSRTFWRLSDDAARISRKLALILRNHHAANRYLAAPLQLSSVWIGSSSCAVKLRGVRFSDKRFSLKRVRDDYRDLARVLQALIRVSSSSSGAGGGDDDDDVASKLPPDYRNFLLLLVSDAITSMEDEFLIVNNPALLPMSNRSEVFLVFYHRIVTIFGRTKEGKKKRNRILCKLPYEQDWLDTARANTEINRYVTGVHPSHPYKRTQLDLLRLNRNVRSHPHEYNDNNIEQVLYCEWPELLTAMATILHLEGELQGTGIHNKFG